jgi:tetratricopeptide (TPR) repeat protein
MPHHAAEALTELGHPAEAIRRYPNNCQYAYLALKRYEELIERFPEPLPEYVYALHALGRFNDLKHFDYLEPGPILWLIIQLYISPERILETDLPDAHVYEPTAILLIALNYLLNGDRQNATDILKQTKGIRAPDLWWGDHNSVELLLASLTRTFLGNNEEIRADLEHVISHHRLKDEQILWHDAGYILGSISETAYKQQPQQRILNQRFTFIQAVAHDLDGERNKARAAYERFLNATQPYPVVNLLRHRFAKWRLQELREHPGTTPRSKKSTHT